MFREVWCGDNIPEDNRVLILGESHYGDEILDAEVTTAGVVQAYLNDNKSGNRKNWAQFFDKIAKSFGYGKDQAEEFYSKVYFGNYIDKFCGVQDDKAAKLMENKENVIRCNNDLFDFANRENIKTIVCFSIMTFYHLPTGASGEEPTKETNIGKIGRKSDLGREYQYLPSLQHGNCERLLEDELMVVAVRHPSSGGGFSPENAYRFLSKKKALRWLCRQQ